MLLRSILREAAWNGFLLVKARGEEVKCRFVAVRMVMAICFGTAPFSLWSMLGNPRVHAPDGS